MMWMFFGLLAAVAAASFSDVFVGSGGDEDEEKESELDVKSFKDEAPYIPDLRLSDTMVPVEQASPTLPQPEHEPDMGLFDDLHERIHSSDLYPPVLPPEPVFLEGDDGDDRLTGSAADDTLSGGGGNDVLVGAGGDNLLRVESGANHLMGGEGDDTLIGGAGNDTLEGGWGNDLLLAGGGHNVLMGGAGDDTLVGAFLDDMGHDRGGENFLNGGAGDDLLIAGQGDTLNGGEGDDIFALGDWLAGRAPAMIVDYSPEQDQIVVHYDPERISQPDVSVTFSAERPDVADIRLNGQVVAHVANASGLAADAIAIIAGHPAAIAAQ